MEEKIWNDQYWIMYNLYPKGSKLWIWMIGICICILIVLFRYSYPVYQTFYGIVEEDQNPLVQVMVPISQIEEFYQAIEQNDSIELKNVQNSQMIANEQTLLVQAIVSISDKLLVKNNIIPIRVIIKKVNLWEEFSAKWKKGMKT